MIALPESVEAQLAPGGLVLVHYVDGKAELTQTLTRQQCDSQDAIVLSADYAAELVEVWNDAGSDVVLRVYDGTTGATLVTIPTGEARRVIRHWYG